MPATQEVLVRAHSAIHDPGSQETMRECRRPIFHVQAASGWSSDPCGPIHYKGQYHMFFQHLRRGCTWNWGLCWDHVVSTDLVHWRKVAPAVCPTPGWYDADGCFTGAIEVDPDTGLPVILYTGVYLKANKACKHLGLPPPEYDTGLRFVETLLAAVPEDPDDPDLIRWRKLETPVLRHPPPQSQIPLTCWRDPHCVVRGNNRDKEWVMLMASGVKGVGGAVLVFKCKKLLEGWRFDGLLASHNTQDLGVDWECPMLARLNPMPSNPKDLLPSVVAAPAGTAGPFGIVLGPVVADDEADDEAHEQLEMARRMSRSLDKSASFRWELAQKLEAKQRELEEQAAAGGKKVSFESDRGEVTQVSAEGSEGVKPTAKSDTSDTEFYAPGTPEPSSPVARPALSVSGSDASFMTATLPPTADYSPSSAPSLQSGSSASLLNLGAVTSDGKLPASASQASLTVSEAEAARQGDFRATLPAGPFENGFGDSLDEGERATLEALTSPRAQFGSLPAGPLENGYQMSLTEEERATLDAAVAAAVEGDFTQHQHAQQEEQELVVLETDAWAELIAAKSAAGMADADAAAAAKAAAADAAAAEAAAADAGLPDEAEAAAVAETKCTARMEGEEAAVAATDAHAVIEEAVTIDNEKPNWKPLADPAELFGEAALDAEGKGGDWFFAISPDACINPIFYWLGNLDDGRFATKKARGPFKFDLGKTLYAATMYEDPLGRHLVWGWVQDHRRVPSPPCICEDYDYAGCISTPRMLYLDGSGNVHQGPLPELNLLRSQVCWQAENLLLLPHAAPLPLPVVSTTHLDIEVTFLPPEEVAADCLVHHSSNSTSSSSSSGSGRGVTDHTQNPRVGLLLKSWRPGGRGAAVITFDWVSRELEVVFDEPLPNAYDPNPDPTVPGANRVGGKLRAPRMPDEPLDLRILMDGSCLEIFTGAGEALTTRVYRGEPPALPARHHATAAATAMTAQATDAVTDASNGVVAAVTPSASPCGIELFAANAECKVARLAAWEMGSCWVGGGMGGLGEDAVPQATMAPELAKLALE